ncbi:protein FAM124B-like [Protopterus annectens]|uniref:protein FAM124B-like n=1 Tax=Protopterus annectens TaxID=7888 RepID=UPI001CFC0B36|nr:protein FAM124B-like [Protopterus annectens]
MIRKSGLEERVPCRQGNLEEFEDSGAETAGSDFSRMSSASSDSVLDEKQDPFLMSVHLLASPGQSFLLQQTLDELLKWTSPEAHLFYVSERTTAVRRCDEHLRKRSGYPAMSVILFLHENLGEERILEAQDFFQNLPWKFHHSESSNGSVLPYMHFCQNFYSLDDDMPVWAIRQVHCGGEILRVTLYCSYDNYEDTVKLYKLILQKEATMQKTNFCYFTLYSNSNFNIQLFIKQLSPRISVDIKESAVLQFRVQYIGQLVPFMQKPCIAISNARWQTEDFDGNKILFQVQDSSQHSQRSCESSQPPVCSCKNILSNLMQYRRTQFPLSKIVSSKDRKLPAVLRNRKTQKLRTVDEFQKGQSVETCNQYEGFASESSCSTPRSSSCCSSKCSSPVSSSHCGECNSTAVQKSNYFHMTSVKVQQEFEMNVDTGILIGGSEVSSDYNSDPLTGFSKILNNCLPDQRTEQSNLINKDIIGRLSETDSDFNQTQSISLAAISKMANCETQDIVLQHFQTKRGDGKQEEEEFFI